MNYTEGEWKLRDTKPSSIYQGYVIESVECGVNLAYAEVFDSQSRRR